MRLEEVALHGVRVRSRRLARKRRGDVGSSERGDQFAQPVLVRRQGVLAEEDHELPPALAHAEVPRTAVREALDPDNPHPRHPCDMLDRAVTGPGVHEDDLVGGSRPLLAERLEKRRQVLPGVERGDDDGNPERAHCRHLICSLRHVGDTTQCFSSENFLTSEWHDTCV